MENPATINNDARPIMELTMAGNEDRWWAIGKHGVTRIVPYLEDNQIWFAIYGGDWLAYRAPASQIENVWYGKAPEE